MSLMDWTRRLRGGARPSAEDLYSKGYRDAQRELMRSGKPWAIGLERDPAMDFSAYDEGVSDAITAHEAGWAMLHACRPPVPDEVPIEPGGACDLERAA